MSTVRGDSRLAEAVRLRQDGLQVFRAMALYNNDRAKDACELLLRLLSETTGDDDILTYKAAIDTYAADLDRTWQ